MASTVVVAQPVPPVISDTTITNGEFRFAISATTASNCVVQTATNPSSGTLFWETVGPVSNSFSIALRNDRSPRHFRVRCEEGLPFYSANMATYFHVQPPPGFSMLGYSLESPSYAVSNLLPSVSEGTLLHWFNAAAQKLETAQFQFGRWSQPSLEIVRGRALLLWSPPQADPIVLHGTFFGGQSATHLAANFNLLSSAWPTGSRVPTEPLCSGRIALELIGTDGIDPVYRTYNEVPPWYDDQFNEIDPPFRAFGGLWFFRPCPGSVWTDSRDFPAMESSNTDPDSITATSLSAGLAAVYFNNYVPGFRIDTRIVHANGEVPSGSNWLAQLYGGAPGDAENDFVAAVAGDPLPFLSGSEAGYIDTTTGATRILTNAAAGGDSLAQIRFWDVRTGPTYESATVKGKTPVFLIPTRSPGIVTTPSVPMLGLMSPQLAISRNMLPTAAALTVQGCAGMTYAIRASGSISNWTAIGTVTNTTSQSTLIDTGANTNQQRFYHATILGPAM